jgi:hypothetical protein
MGPFSGGTSIWDPFRFARRFERDDCTFRCAEYDLGRGMGPVSQIGHRGGGAGLGVQVGGSVCARPLVLGHQSHVP